MELSLSNLNKHNGDNYFDYLSIFPKNEHKNLIDNLIDVKIDCEDYMYNFGLEKTIIEQMYKSDPKDYKFNLLFYRAEGLYYVDFRLGPITTLIYSDRLIFILWKDSDLYSDRLLLLALKESQSKEIIINICNDFGTDDIYLATYSIVHLKNNIDCYVAFIVSNDLKKCWSINLFGYSGLIDESNYISEDGVYDANGNISKTFRRLLEDTYLKSKQLNNDIFADLLRFNNLT